MSAQQLTELASGVDSLYVSARCELAEQLIADLEAAKEQARLEGSPTPFGFGGYDWFVKAGGLNRTHRFRLEHQVATVGVTDSDHVPSLFVQFRSQAIHAVGTDGVLRWLATALDNAGIEASLQVSRIDLHADWQGWNLTGDHRHRFVCRSRSLATYEEGTALSGFGFGNRKSKTIVARIYDKSNEIRHTPQRPTRSTPNPARPRACEREPRCVRPGRRRARRPRLGRHLGRRHRPGTPHPAR